MDPKIPVLFCIDVETDERPESPGDRQPWDGFEATWELFESFRPRLVDGTGAEVRISWHLRMDPQVEKLYGTPTYAVDAHPKLIDAIFQRGDVIGVHPHSFRWDEGLGNWVCDHGSQGWMEYVVGMSFDAYASSLGRQCVQVRFGDYWMSNAATALLERLGARFDLTIEPGIPPMPTLETEFPYTGSLPGFEGAPQEPYHPAADDFRRADPAAGGLWMVPLSSASSRARAPVPPVNPILEPARTIRALGRRVRHPVRTVRPPMQTLSPWKRWRSPEVFWRTAERLLTRLERPYLAFAIRSDIPFQPIQVDSFRGIMENLLRRPLVRNLRFTTTEDGLRELGYLNQELVA